MNPYLEAFLPIISLVITTMLGVAVAYIKKKYDIDVEVADRQALHSALQTGIQAAIQKSERVVDPAYINKEKIISEAVSYAEKSVPDAVRRLEPTPEVMAHIALSKLAQILIPGAGLILK